jgi:hypothetical protein
MTDMIANEKCDTETKILRGFYDTLDGTNWNNNSLWHDEFASYCSWYGVVCDERGISVIKLELGNNALAGELGTEIMIEMSGLAYLEGLDLRGNDTRVCSYSALVLM